MVKKESSKKTLNNLITLISIFLIGIISLISLHIIFLSIMENLDKKVEDQKAKLLIGEYLVNDLYKMRSDFYELATTATNKRGRKLIINRLVQRIDLIKQSLDVLKDGGVLTRVIRLNIVGHSNTTKNISYKKLDKEQISLESIDLLPKLEQFKQMTLKLNALLDEKDRFKREKNYEKFVQFSKKITRFYKTTPAFFIRITENSRRLLYEGENKLQKLEEKIHKEKIEYRNLELLLIFTIIILVLLFAYFIAKQINSNAKKLQNNMKNLKIQERATRGILDGQSNIIVVSDGEKMIDANSALVDFFDKFKNFEEFKEKHACICDFFEDVKNDEKDEFIKGTFVKDLLWYEHILLHQNKKHKVAMRKNKNDLHYFSITATKKILDKHSFIVIITLNDITKEIEVQKKLESLNNNLEDIVDKKTKELQILNENLEKKVDEEVEKNRQKDQKVIQQSRFAALGEMIGNIAHQWRQPLSAISSTASSMQLQLELDLASNDDIKKSYSSIIKYVEFLTQTIEDFRTFFKEDKERKKFNIINILKNSLSITEATYKDRQIEVILNFDSDEFLSEGFPNELSQVFLNILNNAKDALIEHKKEKPVVKIYAYEDENSNYVEIFDNAGGIPQNIITKVFDPYFTTKHQSQGTGIGLYMSKEIVEKHMNGSLSVENKQILMNNELQKGACFIITLPKI